MPAFPSKAKELLKREPLFILLLLTFFLIRIYSLNTPGPYADEIYVPYAALQTKLQVSHLPYPHIDILGYKLPLGISPQSGGFPIYPQVLLLYLTEYSFAYRGLSVLYACLSIIFFYAFLKLFLSKKVAFLSVLLLTFMPSHIFYSRTDPYFILRLTLLGFMFYSFHRWYLQRNWRHFYFGCLATGLGLSTRLEMVMLIIAFPLYLICLNKSLLRDLFYIFYKSIKKLMGGIFFFLLGSSFFILFNVLGHYNVFIFFNNESILKESSPLNAFMSNTYARSNQIKAFFNCGNPFGEVEGTFCSSFPFYFFSFCFLMLLALLVWGRFKNKPIREIEYFYAMSIFVFIQSIPSSSLSPFHNLIVLPLLIVILSYFLLFLPKYIYIPITLLLLMIYTNININYFNTLRTQNENPMWSSSIFKLVRTLENDKIHKIYAGSWGISRLVFLVSKGKITTEEIFGYTGNSNFFINQLKDKMHNYKDNVYVFYAEDNQGGNFGRKNVFNAFLIHNNITCKEMTIYDKFDKPVYYVYRCGRED
jgi:hypothetical protein